MKTSKKLIFSAVVVLAILLIMATPVLAKARTFVGERISLLADPAVTEFPAGEPFHVHHAVVMYPPDDKPVAAAHTGFALEVDGIFVEADWSYTDGCCGPNFVMSGSIFNFPDGLPVGKHSFKGHWYAPCLATGGPCENPMDPVDLLVKMVEIDFK